MDWGKGNLGGGGGLGGGGLCQGSLKRKKEGAIRTMKRKEGDNSQERHCRVSKHYKKRHQCLPVIVCREESTEEKRAFLGRKIQMEEALAVNCGGGRHL